MSHPSTLVLIPARMAATRLPGKPLLDINGLPMIVHVLRRAQEAKIGEAVVATFEAQNPRFKPLAALEVLQALKISHAESLCSADGRFLRLSPHQHEADGFFAAIWQAA